MAKSKETVISELKDCFQKHGKINRKIFNEDKEFSSGKTVYNKFGSFSNACQEANIPHNDKPQKKEKVEILCKQCGKTREVYPYRAEKEFPDGTSETCKKCMDKKQKVSCSWCGEELVRHNYRVSQSENFFCDHTCFGKWRSKNIVGEKHPNYKEGYTFEYGDKWSQIREDVIERDDEKCKNCGVSRERYLSENNIDLDVHHKTPRKAFIEENKGIEKANEMNNLETLCRSCHMSKEWSECR